MTAPARGFGLLAHAISYALVSVGCATPELLSRATPCAGWDLAALLGHVSDSLDVLHGAIGDGWVPPLPAGGGPGPAWRGGPSPQPGAGHHTAPGARPEADLVRAVRCRAGALLAACAAAGAREHVVAIADRHLTASVVAVTGAIEISVHGWDVSAACGRRDPIPPVLAAEMLPLAPVLIPPGMREGLFGEPISLPAANCPGDQLVAFLGRQPGWPGEPLPAPGGPVPG